MTQRRFFNAVRILLNLDMRELVEAGIITDDEAGRTAWHRFNAGPLLFMAHLDDERANKLWALIEARQSPGAAS